MSIPHLTLKRQLGSPCLLAAALAFAAASSPSGAQIVNLADGNSAASINVGSSAGMFNWSVQGQNQLAQQWFWYQVLGGSQPAGAVNTISAPTINLFNGTRGLTTSYAGSGLSIRVDYLLSGGPMVALGQKATSSLSETITLYNTGNDVLNLNFFQYSDFTLGGQANDTVRLGQNLDGFWNEALVRQFGGADLTDTVVTPGADHAEAALYGATLAELNALTPGTHLNDNASVLTPGNATAAFEWDLSIAPGSYVSISKNTALSVIVPEPSALALLALGLAGGLAWRRRQGA